MGSWRKISIIAGVFFLLFGCLSTGPPQVLAWIKQGQYVRVYPYLTWDWEVSKGWAGAVRSNSYGYYISTEREYWLYNIRQKQYQGPMTLAVYQQKITALGLRRQLQLKSWEEILREDYKFADPGYYSAVGGLSYYFDSDDPFSLNPRRVEEERKKYRNKQIMWWQISPYATTTSGNSDYWSQEWKPCSWEMRYNRRNYFNNFYRDFGYGGSALYFGVLAGVKSADEFEGFYLAEVPARLAEQSLRANKQKRQRYAYYAQQLQAMQQAAEEGDVVRLKQLEDEALAESERDYPCP